MAVLYELIIYDPSPMSFLIGYAQDPVRESED